MPPVSGREDDLSLLTNMSAKERAKLNEKGIFTVTQLSYTFRARKAMPVRHYHSLKALAIRKKQIHILGTPSFIVPGTAVYLDVEGNLDRRFYYLIGLRYLSGGSPMQHSFWADDLSQERMIWSSCLNVLAQIDKPILIHYGAYETQFLKTMRQRYSDLLSGPYVDQLIASSVNVLSFTYDRVYFPTYSNSLKDIAGYLGFQWSESSASGRKAMSWRSTWELLRDPDIKQKLLTYNAEDCAALQKISELILSLTSDEALPAHTEPVKVALDTAEYPHQFGEVNFVVPAFSQINKAL
jgi:predicted RecB family nuclease